MYNIFLRRDQIQNVPAFTSSPRWSREHAQSFLTLGAKDLLIASYSAPDADSIRAVLRHNGVHDKVKKVLRAMFVATRNVEGTDASRASFYNMMAGLKVWNGVSAIFFTLNPKDTGCPLTILHSCVGTDAGKHVPFEASDEDMAPFLTQNKQERPGRMHELAAADPVASMRCFHETVRLLIDSLLNCQQPQVPFVNTHHGATFEDRAQSLLLAQAHPDGYPCRCTPGIFFWLFWSGGATNEDHTSSACFDSTPGLQRPEGGCACFACCVLQLNLTLRAELSLRLSCRASICQI